MLFRTRALSASVALGFLIVACGASEKRATPEGTTVQSQAPVACPPLDIPQRGTEQSFRDYLRGLRSQPLCAEPWQATLLKYVQELAIKKDEASNGAKYVEIGSSVSRCSIEARQCFVPVKLKRDLLGFSTVSAVMKDDRLDNAAPIELVHNGAIGADARFMKNCPSGEACEFPIDLLDLLRAPKGSLLVTATTRPLAEEIAAQKAEEARLEEERIKTCEKDCFTAWKTKPKPKGTPSYAESFQKKLDESQRGKCHVECTTPAGASQPK